MSNYPPTCHNCGLRTDCITPRVCPGPGVKGTLWKSIATVSKALEEILAAEIERLEKNYGYRNRFILIGKNNGGHLSMCTTPMTEASKEHMLDTAKRLP